MPHQCVRCGVFYDDGSKEILKGCKCGGKLFFFVKKEKMEAAKNQQYKELTKKEKHQIEMDVFDLIGIDAEADQPVVLDFESIRVLKPGKYELDLVNLFKENPLVYKLGDGKYMIDLPESFKKSLDKK